MGVNRSTYLSSKGETNITRSIHGCADGINVYRRTKGLFGASYSSQYQAVYNEFTVKPSEEVAAEQDTMVRSLVDAGVWDKLDVFYMLANETEQQSLIDWKNPTTRTATAVNSPDFTALEGFKGNGSNSYIDLNYSPEVDAVNYALDSATIGYYVRETDNSAIVDLGGMSGIFVYIEKRSTSLSSIHINSSTALQVALDGIGLIVGTRNGDLVECYHNGLFKSSDNTPISPVAYSDNLYALGANLFGMPSCSPRGQSVIFLSSYLTSEENSNLSNSIETYMDSNGKGVIS